MIHETAIIDPTAKLGKNVTVEAYAIIGADVELGDGCWIGSHAVVKGPSKIGGRCKIFQFASVGEAPQDLSYTDDDNTMLIMGDNNIVRECATIQRGTLKDNGETRIGNGNLFMNYIHVAHDCIIGDDNILANNASLAGHVKLNNNIVLGGFTTVHQFTEIGDYVFSGMQSAINRSIPPFLSVMGNYAYSFGLNKVGLQRAGFSAETLSALNQIYNRMIKKHANKDVIEAARAEFETIPEVIQFIDFIQETERSVIRGKSS